MVHPVARVTVAPKLPPQLSRLHDLTYNLRWAWDHEAISLFRRLDPVLWKETGHNPEWMLGRLSQARLSALVSDSSFMAHYARVCRSVDEYMRADESWFAAKFGAEERPPTIAYFSMEFGLTECLQNYSGGLGVLSGDHLKSASDLGVPLIGVGILYQEGYFQQVLNADGYQQESYPINDYVNLPLRLQLDEQGDPIKIAVPLPGRELYAQIWKVQVGRVALYLLDSNIEDNAWEEDRNLTDRLYGGDRRTRIRQEILMGIGGVRALRALGISADVFHMNEGHSAFLLLERIRDFMQDDSQTFEQARALTAASSIFTVHTPVPAGLERFDFDLIDEHFNDMMRELGLSREQFLDLGRENLGNYELFSMSVMALNLSSGTNGVAQLHGAVSREMWRWVYPNVPVHEVPIGAITNGIHVQTWVSQEMAQLFDRYLDPAWRQEEARHEVWEGVSSIPDAELWRTHVRRRERLVAFARDRLRAQLLRRGVSQTELETADEVLNPDALTIGFARRFATYKRATLIFYDLERLRRLIADSDRPVQFIFAGKAHPHDHLGKELIRSIINVARDPDFRESIVFLENYDMNVARYMVQGVDVWLNTPRRPKEASGTSGMKVIYNGGLNCSIPDGWWAEAYRRDIGWSIGNGEEYREDEWAHQDYVESLALYNLLEQDIVPLFYRQSRDGLPREWIRRVKRSIQRLGAEFNTQRMVQQYTDDLYMPRYRVSQQMHGAGFNQTAVFVDWQRRLKQVWHEVSVLDVAVDTGDVEIGSCAQIQAHVALGQLCPQDVKVQLYYGMLDSSGQIHNGQSVDMRVLGQNGSGAYTYEIDYTYSRTGHVGFSVRVLPHHAFLHSSFLPHKIVWA
ncbi:MAG: alpha-glucan family phosphorylase [Chloroflexi bacterium]|nr:alpha-glucan family phosphorylase [Chloroflexota bacterium]